MHFHSQGKTTKQSHKAIPEGHFEEEQGRLGFYGPVSHLIRKKPSPRWTKIDGNLRPHLYDLNKVEGTSEATLFVNAHCEVGWKRASKSQEIASRNADGDLILFIHKGKGKVITEYGLLDVRAGHYLVIPKCIAYALVVEEAFQILTIESKQGPYREPDRGMVGLHAVYDPNVVQRPDLAAQEAWLSKAGNGVGSVVEVKHLGEKTTFHYEESIFDVVGWRGDNYPFTLHIGDIMPLMSHRAHLPPSAHTTFVAPGFVVCSFVPRPLESDEDALKVPFYHQNIDYDEILFYHAGEFFSRAGLVDGMVTLHPAGFPHGPHPKAMERVKTKTHTNEYAVMIDTRLPLAPQSAVTKTEVADYWKSWRT